jgi:hypothetical protein
MPIKVFWLIGKTVVCMDAIAREIICYSNYFSPMLLTRPQRASQKIPTGASGYKRLG